ncbi:hypothetical protein BHE74_00008752 [Ensete ventricosum]|nr:hypothetical protein BHE74_00008752 [Ensete ventricosum]
MRSTEARGFIYSNRVTPCNMHASSSSAQQHHPGARLTPLIHTAGEKADTVSFIVTTITMNSMVQLGAKRINASDDEERKPFRNLQLFSATVFSTSVSSEEGSWGQEKGGGGGGGKRRGHMGGCNGRRYGESWEILQEWDASLRGIAVTNQDSFSFLHPLHVSYLWHSLGSQAAGGWYTFAD